MREIVAFPTPNFSAMLALLYPSDSKRMTSVVSSKDSALRETLKDLSSSVVGFPSTPWRSVYESPENTGDTVPSFKPSSSARSLHVSPVMRPVKIRSTIASVILRCGDFFFRGFDDFSSSKVGLPLTPCKYDQDRPVYTPMTKAFDNPRIFAISGTMKPSTLIFMIFSAVSSLIDAFPPLSPNGARLRKTVSDMFSAWVPHRKWFGLQQEGLSQECRESAPSDGGKSPENIKASLLDRIDLPSCQNVPYPILVLPFIQGQHSSFDLMSTLRQKFSMSASCFEGQYTGNGQYAIGVERG